MYLRVFYKIKVLWLGNHDIQKSLITVTYLLYSLTVNNSQSQRMIKCKDCGKFLSKTNVVGCVQCQAKFHSICARVPTGAGASSAWRCPECRCSYPTDNRDDTPVRGIGSQLPAWQSPAAADDSIAGITGRGGTVSDSEELTVEGAIQLFREELQEVRREIHEFRSEFFELRIALPPITERMDEIDRRLDDVEKRVAANVADSAVKVLEEAVANLQLELHDRDQERLDNDVLITNVVEGAGENVLHIVTTIGTKLGVNLDEKDIVFVERLGRRREGGRPRPIVVRLTRRATRGELMRAARVRRGATTAGCGLAGEARPFYINERLTRRNQELFQKARERCRLASWRYVWTRDGRIFVRRAEGEHSHRIRRETDMESIFHVRVVNVENV